MEHFTTPKGTTLPLMNIKGKLYLQVAHRIQWFREDHPDWVIETIPVKLEPEIAIFKAEILTAEGKLLACAHKSETPKGFPDHIEKSETGAIGRALALCGYGTQFTSDLEEGDRLADSPTPVVSSKVVNSSPQVVKAKPVDDPGKYMLHFGKFFKKNGNKPIAVERVDPVELKDWYYWIKEQNTKPGNSPRAETLEALEYIGKYLDEAFDLQSSMKSVFDNGETDHIPF